MLKFQQVCERGKDTENLKKKLHTSYRSKRPQKKIVADGAWNKRTTRHSFGDTGRKSPKEGKMGTETVLRPML